MIEQRSDEKRFPLRMLQALAERYDAGWSPPGYPDIELLENRGAGRLSSNLLRYPVDYRFVVFKDRSTGRSWQCAYYESIVIDDDDETDRSGGVPCFNADMDLERDEPEPTCFEVVAVEHIAVRYESVRARRDKRSASVPLSAGVCEYARLLVEAHRVQAWREDADESAEALYDEMTDVWKGLSEDERGKADSIAGFLNLLEEPNQ